MSDLPVRHTFGIGGNLPASHFRGQKKEAPPLPISQGRSSSFAGVSAANEHFGVVSQSTNPQALTGLSWLSYSPSGV